MATNEIDGFCQSRICPTCKEMFVLWAVNMRYQDIPRVFEWAESVKDHIMKCEVFYATDLF